MPEDKIRARYTRSMQQLPWFLQQADEAWIYDNSGGAPKQIGVTRDGMISLSDEALAAVRGAVESIEVE